MPELAVRRVSRYTQEQIYALIADVGRYSEFFPYCVESTILQQQAGGFVARLGFAYKGMAQSFDSVVELTPQSRIRVRHTRGVFAKISLEWRVEAQPKGSEVCLELSYRLLGGLGRLLTPLQAPALAKAIAVFENRADTLYG